MNPAAVLNLFRTRGALLEGHFVLSSGLHSTGYLQCALVLQHPADAEALGRALADRVRVAGHDVDVVLAPAMGGVIIGHEVGRALGVRAIFAERQDGIMTLRRGFRLDPGERVLVVEDVVTTGKSTVETVTVAEQAGAMVTAAVSIIDRGGGDTLTLPYLSLAEARFPTFAADAIPASLHGVPAVKPRFPARPAVMARLLLSLYDGTAYAGWQRQQNGVSIQACVEDALAPLAGAPVTVNGAGRTDAGVHAEGQMAHVDLPDTLTPDVVLRAANARLPRDIRVRAAWTVADTLHARHSATSKTYRYRWLVSRIGHPLLGRTASLADPPLDVAVMHEACRYLMGTHDFAAFRSAGSPVLSTTRTVTAARVTERGPLVGIELDEGEALVEFEITGDGFLRHMVRALAGTLELVGHGRHPASWMAQVLASGDRSAAGATAAAHGLTLVQVTYRVE